MHIFLKPPVANMTSEVTTRLSHAAHIEYHSLKNGIQKYVKSDTIWLILLLVFQIPKHSLSPYLRRDVQNTAGSLLSSATESHDCTPPLIVYSWTHGVTDDSSCDIHRFVSGNGSFRGWNSGGLWIYERHAEFTKTTDSLLWLCCGV